MTESMVVTRKCVQFTDKAIGLSLFDDEGQIQIAPQPLRR